MDKYVGKDCQAGAACVRVCMCVYVCMHACLVDLYTRVCSGVLLRLAARRPGAGGRAQTPQRGSPGGLMAGQGPQQQKPKGPTGEKP